MRSSLSSLLVVGAVVLAAGCSSDGPTDVAPLTISDLVGSWSATSEVFTNNADPSQKIDLIALGGENRFTMLPGGATRTWIDAGTFHDEWDSQATLDASGTTLTLTPAEASRGVVTFTATLDGTVLTLHGTNVTFDFTLTDPSGGTPATVDIVFVKTG